MPTQELPFECAPLDLLTTGPWRRAFLLDGSGTQSWDSGYAFFGHTPRATLRVNASGAAQVTGEEMSCPAVSDPLTLLGRFWQDNSKRMTDAAPGPFAGGVIAVLSYDLAHWIERLPCSARDDQALPVLECSWYDWVLRFDYRTGTWTAASAFLTSEELRTVSEAILAAPRRCRALSAPPSAPITSSFTRAGYTEAVRRALEYIATGDIYQVNLAQRFAARCGDVAPAAMALGLFVRWQQRHPMPFAAFIDCDDFVVVSNSPECFLAWTPERIATFPIKGTRPRGADNARDVANTLALQTSPKEGAEHVMIVDLERNDLGRLCETGSVAVRSFATVHSYPTLHHLVSEVGGRLRPGTALSQILRATFPGGSITGAPKIRAMEIIDELEPVRRGVYTGAVGFIDGRGHGVLNIAIRTAIACGGQLTYHAGGGIVADSDPSDEYEETLLKARAFFDACDVRTPAFGCRP